jgi:hypothetical protein
MVYGYLTPEKHILYCRSHSHESTEVSFQNPLNDYCFESIPYFETTNLRSSSGKLCSEHFWRDEALGNEIAQELMESWYRDCTFEMTCYP